MQIISDVTNPNILKKITPSIKLTWTFLIFDPITNASLINYFLIFYVFCTFIFMGYSSITFFDKTTWFNIFVNLIVKYFGKNYFKNLKNKKTIDLHDSEMLRIFDATTSNKFSSVFKPEDEEILRLFDLIDIRNTLDLRKKKKSGKRMHQPKTKRQSFRERIGANVLEIEDRRNPKQPMDGIQRRKLERVKLRARERVADLYGQQFHGDTTRFRIGIYRQANSSLKTVSGELSKKLLENLKTGKPILPPIDRRKIKASPFKPSVYHKQPPKKK